MIARFARLSLLMLFAAVLIATIAPTVHAADEKAHATEHAPPGHNGMDPNPSVADWRSDLAMYSFVVFMILMTILTKFAWGPISVALDKREKSVADNIASAERAALTARAMLADYENKLSGAADQVRALLEEAKRDADTTKAGIIAEAKAAAEAEQQRAVRDIRAATDGALKQLAEKSADLAVDLAGKMLQAKMTKDDHARLVQDGVSKFISGTPSKN